MAFRWQADDGPTLNADLVALWFLRESGPVLPRNPIFLWVFFFFFFFFFFFLGGGGVLDSCPPPLDPPMCLNEIKSLKGIVFIWVESHPVNVFCPENVSNYNVCCVVFLTLCLPASNLVMTAADLCKHVGTRSGLTECQTWSGSKLCDTLIAVFLKKLKTVNLKKISSDTQIKWWKITQHATS